MARNRKRMAGDIFKRRKLEKRARRKADRQERRGRDPRPAARRADFDFKPGKNPGITQARQRLAKANDDVSNLVRHAESDTQRKYWTDTYDDDGRIYWSTNSARGTKERRQERRTMRFLERQTGLDFKRTNANSGKTEIHIDRYDDGKDYFKRYEGKDWYDNMGFIPGGLHHYDYDPNRRRYSRIEVPNRKAVYGNGVSAKGTSQKVLSHEIGHALGLRDLSNPNEQATTKDFSVMSYKTPFRAVKGPVRFGLSDINAIKLNYGLS